MIIIITTLFFIITCVKLATRNAYILRGNPKQNGIAVGTGKTVNVGYKFKYIGDQKYYWTVEIGKTSKNIHK